MPATSPNEQAKISGIQQLLRVEFKTVQIHGKWFFEGRKFAPCQILLAHWSWLITLLSITHCLGLALKRLSPSDKHLIDSNSPYAYLFIYFFCIQSNLCAEPHVFHASDMPGAIIHPSEQHVNSSQTDSPFNVSVSTDFGCWFSIYVESCGCGAF